MNDGGSILLLVLATIAPTAAMFGYVYYKDIFKNDLVDLAKAFGLGIFISLPAIIGEWSLKSFGQLFFNESTLILYKAFIVAALTEELLKYASFKSLAYKKQIYDPYDSIVFSTCISLGFATLENFLYIFSDIENGQLAQSFSIAFYRGLTAVPAHALFGIIMGYFFAKAQFNDWEEKKHLFLALTVPVILHGIYDYILMSENNQLLLGFVPFLIIMWIIGIRCIKQLE